MKKLFSLLLAAMLLALPVLALADGELTAIGTATVTLSPDMTRLSVGVETHAETVQAASELNNETLNAVVEAMIAMGVAAKDISTSNYYVYTEYDYSATPARLVGYSVSNTLNVLVSNVGQIGEIIDAATAAGANQIYGVTFLSSLQDEGHDRALTLAIQEGMRKAQLMAIAAGRSLGQLVNVRENEGQSYGVTVAYDRTSAVLGTSIMPEELEVYASVTLTYELR